MKKYIALFLCVAMLFALTACGKDTPTNGDAAPSTTQSTTTTTTAPTGEGSTTADGGTTTTATDAADTTTVPSTGGTTAPTGTGTPTTSTTAPTKVPSSSATGSQPTTEGSKPTSTAPTTGTTKPAEPDVVLPAIGTDIDVTNGRDRIRVSAATAAYNADGTIAVSLTFKNYNKTYITEETNWVEYTCYDAAGNAIQTEKINIGCIDTKKNATKTFTFTVPAAAAEVKLTDSKIIYWTEWS